MGRCPLSTIDSTTGKFTIGVVAFHTAGIAKVSFSLQDGPWVNSTAMIFNLRTKVFEYTATIDPADFDQDQPIEVRAIAFPKTAAPL